ncbi:MAG: molybdate ABC transporter permease subunit [Gammaproteobacteria bacterium]|nr:molybdate ABC transporter permease subunit [Gammaproteobacteria bacterium]
MLSPDDLTALVLTVKLALVVTMILLLVSFPLAWWLAHSRSRLTIVINALVTMPLVLPPTVLGFYFLLAMAPQGFLGQAFQAVGLDAPAFSFSGLVIGSIVYSLPFVVQPLQNTFLNIGSRPMQVAASLGAGRIDRFFTVLLPLAKKGLIVATVLGFAHTVGEFGVVLMIGGSIPGETKVVAIQIYEYVELIDYAKAHRLSLLLVGFSFVTLLILYRFTAYTPMWVAKSKEVDREST